MVYRRGRYESYCKQPAKDWPIWRPPRGLRYGDSGCGYLRRGVPA
jgi:hypothetical protein